MTIPNATIIPTESAYKAYEELAADYDTFTAGYPHEQWFSHIHARLKQLGVPGNRAIDLACGTGKSTMPLIAAGYDVSACDLSPRMIYQAKEAHPHVADRFFVADLMQLPDFRTVDLALCLDDAMNYLPNIEALQIALDGIYDRLNPGGLLAFDVNSWSTFTSAFTSTFVRAVGDRYFIWEGLGSPDDEPGGVFEATVDAFTEAPGGWQRRTSRHIQRHFAKDDVAKVLEQAGFAVVDVAGQREGGILENRADERVHPKIMFIARRS
jgi:SAM-dependent methyltransferase